MKFANPQWLWALAALPLAYFLLSWDERRRKRQFERFAAPTVWARVAPEADSRARLRKARYWVLGMAFVIAATARPQWGSHEEVVKVSGLDIMIVLDVSNSMEVEDIVPSRLKKAKHLIKAIAEKLHGDRVGTVAFAGSAFLASPLTTDLDYLVENSSILGPRLISNQGTDIGIGLETARKALERGAEEVRPSGSPGEPPPNSSRAIILISDGEDFEGGAIEEARALKQAGIKTYVIGVGTEKGGPIPIRDDAGNLQGYKRDRNQQPIVSSFRPDALMRMASTAGGRYWNATTGETEIDEVLQDVGALNRSDYAERRYLVFEDRFQVPLAIGILILLLELSMPARKVSSKDRLAQRREQEATFARIALPVIAAMLLSTEARASPLIGKQPPLDVYVDNEKGLKAYKSGDVEEAKKEFGSAQAKDPSLPELQFNRGVVQLREGDLDGSIEAFANAAAAARGASGAQNSGKAEPDEHLAGQSFYNLGQALAKKGDLGKAVASYVESIRSAQASGDVALEQDARKNIELLVQQQQKQKQQQKQDQEQQQQQQQQDQQQQQKQDQKQDKQDQARQYQDPKKHKQFKSEKLSPEDAERVMAELAGKERELQTKLKTQHGNSANNAKDW